MQFRFDPINQKVQSGLSSLYFCSLIREAQRLTAKGHFASRRYDSGSIRRLPDKPARSFHT